MHHNLNGVLTARAPSTIRRDDTEVESLLRAILNFFGFLFSWAVLGMIMGGMGLTTLFWVYSQDLPNYEQLALYEPPTLSRIYSARGLVMDEFARERRIFTPVDEMPRWLKLPLSAPKTRISTITPASMCGASAVPFSSISRISAPAAVRWAHPPSPSRSPKTFC